MDDRFVKLVQQALHLMANGVYDQDEIFDALNYHNSGLHYSLIRRAIHVAKTDTRKFN